MCVASGEQQSIECGQVKRIGDETIGGCWIATMIRVRGIVCV